MKQGYSSSDSKTDWFHLDKRSDDDIDYSDISELSAENFAHAVVREGLDPAPTKKQITLRVDADVLEWFKSRGKGYQTRMNALLRAYMEAHSHK